METQVFDFIVIGSGAGLNVASPAARQGLSVAVIEEGSLGGTCLNRGCIPSKLLIHPADVAETIRRAQSFGLEATLTNIHFADIVKRVSQSVDKDSVAIAAALEKNQNITLFRTRGRFIAERLLEVEGRRITAPKILIAAGARPHLPDIDGLAETPYLTSTEALRLTIQPKHLIVIGGGYIAAELSHFFGSLGTAVTIISRNSTMLRREDSDISKNFTRVFGKKHQLLLEHQLVRVSHDGRQFSVTVRDKNGEQILRADQLLVATGVVPNSDTLAVDAAGVATDKRGFIKTNEYLETSADGIWALGDIIGKYLFRHSANWEARYVLHNIFGNQKNHVDYTAMPHAVFSSPQVASVGATEQELQAAGVEYETARYDYSNTAMGQAFQEADGFVKVLVNKGSKEILGCHIIGPEASTLIHEVVVAMKLGGDVSAITNAVHVHPALSEVVQRAFLRVY